VTAASDGFYVVIPGRFASTRLPGKPLADIGGLPMIVRVAHQAARSRARQVVVAVDDERVEAVLRAHAIDAVMTRKDHESGSDRVMEVVERMGWAGDDIVVNVQGDEPLIPPAVIDQVAGRLASRPDYGIATLCEPIDTRDQVFNPNLVKVTRSIGGRALYFSRAPMPWDRSRFASSDASAQLPAQRWWRHIGIYGYRVETLRRFCSLPPGALERTEALEQLRALENDVDILVDEAVAPVPGGVDTPEDLERMRRLVAQ